MLSNKQSRVKDLIVQGFSNAEIANILGVEEKTIKFHITDIFKYESVKSRSELIAKHYQPDYQKEKSNIMQVTKIEPKAIKTQEEKIQFVDQTFHVGQTMDHLHKMMMDVTKESMNPATVNAACNCVARLNETINTAIQAARFLNER